MKLDDYYDQEYQKLLDRLQAARLEASLTQEEVAARLGRSQSFVSRSETGERRIDVIELQAFATIYQRPMSYFLGSTDE
ncbi:MAG: XRE family transcriptional regulator [Anaerolineales bacterium]|nr:MAG: XRE family transcriptional regulator [Anaerolineales bacterium]